jgi:hypothetical protein
MFAPCSLHGHGLFRLPRLWEPAAPQENNSCRKAVRIYDPHPEIPVSEVVRLHPTFTKSAL